MKPYDDNLEHLLDELSRIDLLMRTYLESLLEDFPEVGDEFRGLYVSETEIERIRRNPGFGSAQGLIQDIRIEKLKEIHAVRKEIDSKIEQSLKIGRELRLQNLSKFFGLDPFEIDILLIGLAPELDLKYEKLYSYLQNDVTKKRPSVDLVIKFLCHSIKENFWARGYFSATSSLIKNRILYLIEDEKNGHTSLLSRHIKIDDRIINYLLGYNDFDPRIRSFSTIIESRRSSSELILEEDSRKVLKRLIGSDLKNPVVLFYGPYGTGKKMAAEVVCKGFGMPLLVLDSRALLRNESLETLNISIREALLQNSILYIDGFDSLWKEKDGEITAKEILMELDNFPNIVFLSGEQQWEPAGGLINHSFISLEFPTPSLTLRNRLWESILSENIPDDADISALASKFKFSGGQIKDAIFTARNKAIAKGSTSLSIEDIYQGCKAQSNRNLLSLARKIEPHYSWEDIILPKDIKEQLSEVSRYIKHRGTVYVDWGFDRKLSLGKGLNVLFSGPSGTGKTMASEIIAKDAKLDLYKIDLSNVVSKYIGDTEKNLSKIFSEAETSNAILFFDEADAIFGKRSDVKDAHDRYANIEIGYLLQRMEEHEGIVILATNLHRNIDDAFLRRMQFVIEFPFPDEKLRLQIWTRIFPKDAPLAKDVNYKFFSDKLKLAGGNIKNIALTAAFQAAEESCEIGMRQIMHATKREYQKIGKPFLKVDFEPYYNLIESDDI